mgnify:CR=1 FL=1
MNPLFKAVDTVISWWCHVVLYITLSVVFVILSVNVCLRYAAGTSLSWASELPELMFPWMIMSGVVIAAQHDESACITQGLRGGSHDLAVRAARNPWPGLASMMTRSSRWTSPTCAPTV